MDAELFLARACELLAIPSVSEQPGELRRALDYVLDFVGPGFTVERFESGGKPSALVYPGAERREFGVVLNAHLDVVPAPPAQFRPRREGTRLFARGAQDMKLSGLLAAQVFREQAARLRYPLALQLVTDEEVGGRDGTLAQLGHGVRGGFVIVGETSGLDVVNESKGMLVARLLATGRNAHAAYPWLGDNALVKLQNSVARLLARYPAPAEEVWRTTVTLARVRTQNQARNQVPADAEALLDIRFPAADADLAGRTSAEVAAYLEGFCEPGVTPVVDILDPPHRAGPDQPEVRALQQAARRQGFGGGLLRKHGVSDGRFYGQLGIPAVAFGVGGAGQHGPDEYADLTTVVPYYRALSDFLTGSTIPGPPASRSPGGAGRAGCPGPAAGSPGG